jgi:hypothetical protein
MKIKEYIINNTLTKENCINSYKYFELINFLISNNSKYIKLELTEDILYENSLCTTLKQLSNKIILFLNVDIDFPPPKKPYTYDTNFHKYNMPENYESISYYDKIDKNIIDIIEKNNLFIVTYSVSINHPNIIFVPLGIYSQFNHFHLKTKNKDILCYLNMGIPCDRWFGNPRKNIIDSLKDKSFVTKRNGLAIDEFYNDISRSKFMICPRGCGIDTYRLWDCIILGCIPIVEKYESHIQWDDLPILFLNDISEYDGFTEEFLNKKYDEFLEKDFNYEKCKMKYWQNLIENMLYIFTPVH